MKRIVLICLIVVNANSNAAFSAGSDSVFSRPSKTGPGILISVSGETGEKLYDMLDGSTVVPKDPEQPMHAVSVEVKKGSGIRCNRITNVLNESSYNCYLTVLPDGSITSTITYSCHGYVLQSENGAYTLVNSLANSSSKLEIAGPSSSHSASYFYGALKPLGMNVLTRVLISIDPNIKVGAQEGKISVGSAADSNIVVNYDCNRIK